MLNKVNIYRKQIFIEKKKYNFFKNCFKHRIKYSLTISGFKGINFLKFYVFRITRIKFRSFTN